MGNLLAHIRVENNRCLEQTVAEHCRHTAEYASKALEDIGLGKLAYLSGLMHDMGKCKQEFQDYLLDENNNERIIHSFQGVKFALEEFGDGQFEELTKEIIGYAIGSHHGVFDCVNEERKSGFIYRENKSNTCFEECKDNYLREVCDLKKLEHHFNYAKQETENVIEKIRRLSMEVDNSEIQNIELYYYVGVLARLILSATIEGDRRDTAEFMLGEKYSDNDNCQRLWESVSDFYESKILKFDNSSSINQARKKISDQCKEMAETSSTLFRLNVPTGSGKTLSSLRFAVNHAKNFKKSRIFFVSPLLSILEQNTKVLREFIGNQDIVFEHHSNVIMDSQETENSKYIDYLKDSWNSPVIITTFVQLLDTMFAGKTSNIRRFHSLCNSVVVIDEIQSLPPKLTSMFNLTCNFLSKICNTTIVLCSATQPTLEKVNHRLITPITEMVPYNEELWSAFDRTELIDIGNKNYEEVAEFVLNDLKNLSSVLLVCNTKKEAFTFYDMFNNTGSDVFQLSANMCMQHRKDVLVKIKQSLEDKEKRTIVVATQVIEAGVDISFACVIRILAGMDNIVQAAGRCNRNAENGKDLSKVYLVNLQGEKLGALKDIQDSQNATIGLLDIFRKHPDRFENKLDSSKAISFYYNNYFQSIEINKTQDYPIQIEGSGTMLDLLSNNTKFNDEDAEIPDNQMLRQSFMTAAKYYSVFDQNTVDIVVPYKEGKELITKLHQCNGYELKTINTLVQQAKSYTVSVYSNDFQLLLKESAIQSIFDAIYVLDDERFYDVDAGFTIHPEENLKLLEV